MVGDEELAGVPSLRVLVVHAGSQPHELLGGILARLGQEVVDGPVADVVVAAVAVDSPEALAQLRLIVDEAISPVIAVVRAATPEQERAASTLGVFAAIVNATEEALSTALDTTLRRFVAYRRLHGASGPWAEVEQARGILMAHHAVGSEQAYEMLREHAEHTGHTLFDTAAALVTAHPLLSKAPPPGD
jgi:AmiR/NasT family two-component response regulator